MTRASPNAGTPHHDGYDPTDVATDEEVSYSDRLRSDDVEAWERRCKWIIDELARGPSNITTLQNLGRWRKVSPKMTTECVYWLENRGAIVGYTAFGQRRRMYRLVRVGEVIERVEPKTRERKLRFSLKAVRMIFRQADAGEMTKTAAWAELRKLAGV